MDERVFDVSKPHKSNPGHTSKPIIVGHQPQIPDPMLRENAPDKPDIPQQPEFGPPSDENPLGLPLAASEPMSDHPVEPALPPELTAAVQEQSTTPDDIKPPEPASPPVTADTTEQPQPVDRKADEPPLNPPVFNKATGQTVEPTPTSWAPSHELPISGGGHRSTAARKKAPLIILAAVAGAIGLYLLLDSGIVGGVKMPFSLFGSDDTSKQTAVTPISNQPVSSPAPTQTNFAITGTDISFDYPASWGLASTTRDPGFSKRGGENKTDGTYAYIINFAGNKDVQIVATSAQYLPAERDPLYYDFQQWCTGTADGKIYREVLQFSTSGGVDTPTTAVCDNGPLAGATKSSDALIIQLKTSDGDIYTQNLVGSDYPVIRVKDSTGKNAKEIEALLASIKN